MVTRRYKAIQIGVFGCISIAAVMASQGCGLTPRHFEQRKVTKRSCPYHAVPRFGSACPHTGIAP